MIYEFAVTGMIRIDAATPEEAAERIARRNGAAIHFKRAQLADDFQISNQYAIYVDDFIVSPVTSPDSLVGLQEEDTP